MLFLLFALQNLLFFSIIPLYQLFYKGFFMKHVRSAKNNWSGRFGFLMAAVGSAVGIGNIWRFPYVAGQQGGAVFLIVYIAMIVFIGFSAMIAEFAIGRNAASNVIDAFSSQKKAWGVVGILSCIVSFIIVSYYSVIGGWVIRYAVGYIAGGNFVADADYSIAFSSFVSNPYLPIIFTFVFMALCFLILMFGVQKGIERVNKILMPMLFIMLVFVMIVSLTMDGAKQGVEFFIVPDINRIEASGGIVGILLAALGQSFYSLSIGIGIGTTYGSYARKDVSLTQNTAIICISDTLVAVVAGFAILPAVFAAGQEPTAGAGLIFVTLPAVFASLPHVLGMIVGAVFFLLVFFAALTSAIALIEVNVAVLSEKLKLNRKLAVAIVVLAAFFLAIFVSLSQGAVEMFDLLNILDVFSNTFMLPLIGILTCIYVGFVWKTQNAVKEISLSGPFKLAKIWAFNIKFICPVFIGALFVYGIVSLFI